MGAAPIHHTEVVDTPWDGPAAEKAFDKKAGDFPKFYAWIDKGEADPDATGEDKEDGWGPHHEVDADGVPGAANINGVHAAVAALNGAHGTTSRIPDGDRQGVFDHLVAHLKDAGVADEDLPTLRSETPAPSKLGRKRRHRSGPVIGREFRYYAVQGLEVRSASDGSDQIEITGMPIVYNAPYTVRDMFGEFEETMLPGVAADVLAAGADVRFLFNHDGMPLARTASGTLVLNDTRTGLGISAFMDARSNLANDLAVAIERKDINQMSCGFVVGQDEWNNDYTQRSISKFEQLFDVSAVTYPASPTTSIELALRSLWSQPVETQARTRQLWIAVGRDLRAGKALSAENAGHLQSALDALSSADDIDIPSIVQKLQSIDAALDGGQAGLAHVLGKVNPDGSAKDLELALVPPASGDETTAGIPENDDATTTPSTEPSVMQDGTGSRSEEEHGEQRMFIPAPYHHDPDEVVVCANCGLTDDADARFCDQCGAELTAQEAYSADPDETVQCPECDLFNDIDARYCDQCGYQLIGSNAGMVKHDDNEDAGMRSGIPATAAERRAAERSFNDIERAVNDAISKAYGEADDDPWCDIWLEDCGDGWCVFHSYEANPGVGLWKISYSLDDSGCAVLGDDLTEVVEQTSYVPVETSAGPAAQFATGLATGRAEDPALALLALDLERLQMRGRRNHAVT